ncbi:MAG: V-type ATP synthase subunit E [Clostridia bacterium]|nr:V-type ATP synthase subunit E [Clostridia bacterium]
MSGVEKIIARLNEETEAQCDAIIATAEEKAAQIVSRAQTQGNEIIRNAEEEAKKQAAQIDATASSTVVSNSRKDMLGAKVELLDSVLADAKKRLHDLSDDAYFSTLAGLAKKNRQEGPGEMLLCERDLKRMPSDFIDKLGYGFTVSPVPADIEDGFILKYGDIEVNCTFAALFRAYSQELQAKANELLFK